jgi:hypothetical protein
MGSGAAFDLLTNFFVPKTAKILPYHSRYLATTSPHHFLDYGLHPMIGRFSKGGTFIEQSGTDIMNGGIHNRDEMLVVG